MENPNMIFLTPTLLAGDRSLANVMLHEIAHSWSGNPVTMAAWQHFWLNEGLTVFLENRVLKRLFGAEAYALHMEDCYTACKESVEGMLKINKSYASLAPDYSSGADPDDGFSSIPYMKGMALFCFMEHKAQVSEQKFDAWIKSYFAKFSGKSVTAPDMINHYERKFGKGLVNWNKWLYEPGMPAFWPKYDTAFIKPIKANAKDVEWTTGKYIVLLDHLLEKDVTTAQLKALQARHNFDASTNPELIFRWAMLGIKGKRASSIKSGLAMLGSVGRMKFARPLSRQLLKYGQGPAAIKVVEKAAKEFYHPITTRMVKMDLGLK